jgi:hypothetical protein
MTAMTMQIAQGRQASNVLWFISEPFPHLQKPGSIVAKFSLVNVQTLGSG